MSSGYCSLSSNFLPEKVNRVATFQEHLMLHLSTKPNNTSPWWSNIVLHPIIDLVGQLALQPLQHHSKVANTSSL